MNLHFQHYLLFFFNQVYCYFCSFPKTVNIQVQDIYGYFPHFLCIYFFWLPSVILEVWIRCTLMQLHSISLTFEHTTAFLEQLVILPMAWFIWARRKNDHNFLRSLNIIDKYSMNWARVWYRKHQLTVQ